MTQTEDEAAVLAALNGETQAWLRRDMEALATFWVHSPKSRRMSSVAHHGAQVQEGWDAIYAALKSMAVQFPATFAESRVRHERMNIVVNGDTAWVTYEQVGDKADDDFEMVGTQHELKVFHRVDGRWKISCIVVMQRTIDHESRPLIEIGADRRVLWMNADAHEQLTEHPVLMISGGFLRARHRNFESALQEAVDWSSQRLHWKSPDTHPSRLARAVVLGETDDAGPAFCWVLLEDGKILVSFNDDKLVKQRVEVAKGIYALTAAQAQLAHLLVQGQDIAVAANKLGVSVNTVRTHLQRLFDKTGARTQSALVSLLLSVEPHTA